MRSWMKWLGTSLAGVLLATGGAARAEDSQKSLPKGWFVTESAPKLYASGLDTGAPCEGPRSAYLRSVQESPSGYGTFMQAFDAEAFRGKRLRFSAVVRTEDVKGWAGLWMRVEGAESLEPLAFDNMQSRALTGTTACKRHEVVLDVPPEARAIMAGLLLSGTGTAWIEAVRFEPVDTRVPVTNLIADTASRRPSGGRIGGLSFSADALGNGLRLQPDGSWKDTDANVLTPKTTEDGGVRVEGSLLHRAVRLTVKTTGGTTLVQGDWGSDAVHLTLGPDKLVLKRGIHTRELVPEEDTPAEKEACRRYRTPPGTTRGVLDVCGLALDKAPPVIPLVVGLLTTDLGASRTPTLGPGAAPPDRLTPRTGMIPNIQGPMNPADRVAPLRTPGTQR
ncbi:AraC family transcriptional regulator [Archangium primigenium]|uniref:AraC family transcriptional regulator n=1 Tax=[Archangium] primigenium TaxID=2792470 RepID=UPI001957B1D0|nr:AraC family transcriptional regulator [Archangium primigenium]MBM7118446.1 AraC family transcriptional regulator [Archangium primigenium]